ncbi:hypothetical protein ACFW9O_09160 [Streptomyces sp. NPDC059499]|uniref:hypothetical protein n=1 Tax=Streptomyces sp. NPDC059499 TaxID=3346852 RepID=UPI003677CC46
MIAYLLDTVALRHLFRTGRGAFPKSARRWVVTAPGSWFAYEGKLLINVNGPGPVHRREREESGPEVFSGGISPAAVRRDSRAPESEEGASASARDVRVRGARRAPAAIR